MNLHRALILVVLLSLTGCNPAPEQTFPSPTESVESNFVELTKLNSLIGEVETQVDGPIRFLELRVDKSYFEIQVQDPKKPENADSYQTRGGPIQRVPLQMGAATGEDITASSIPLSDWNREVLPNLLQELEKRGADLEEPKHAHFLIRRAADGTPEWTLFLSSPRRSVDMSAGLDGSIRTP